MRRFAVVMLVLLGLCSQAIAWTESEALLQMYQAEGAIGDAGDIKDDIYACMWGEEVHLADVEQYYYEEFCGCMDCAIYTGLCTAYSDLMDCIGYIEDGEDDLATAGAYYAQGYMCIMFGMWDDAYDSFTAAKGNAEIAWSLSGCDAMCEIRQCHNHCLAVDMMMYWGSSAICGGPDPHYRDWE